MMFFLFVVVSVIEFGVGAFKFAYGVVDFVMCCCMIMNGFCVIVVVCVFGFGVDVGVCC